ncbi:hypothetical protein GCM10027098_38800 [Bowmanella dokdonensis]
MGLLLVLTACGGSGGGSESAPSPTPNPSANQAPVISAANVSAIEGEEVTVSATVTDADGQISDYIWQQVSGPEVDFQQPGSASLTFTAPAVEADDRIVFELQVTDNDGAQSKGQISVNVLFNHPPQFGVEDQTVMEQAEFSLSVEALDTDGGIASYVWEQISGPAVANLVTEANRISFSAPDVSVNTALEFKLVVSDRLGKSAEKTFKVTVEEFEYRFDLVGQLTAPLFAGAEVVVAVGEQNFSGNTDETGKFRIALNLGDDAAVHPVIVTARAASPYDKLAVSSVPGTVDSIYLSAKEVEGQPLTYQVQIDHITSAIHAELDKAIVSAEDSHDLISISSQIRAADIIPTGMLFKLMLDDYQAGELSAYSAQINDLLAYSRQQQEIPELLDDIQGEREELYYSKMNDFISDLPGFSIDGEETFYFYESSTQNTSDSGKLSLKQDGTGVIHFSPEDTSYPNGAADFSWTEIEEQINFSVDSEKLFLGSWDCFLFYDINSSFCDVFIENLEMRKVYFPNGEPVLLINLLTRAEWYTSESYYKPILMSMRWRTAEDLILPESVIELDKEYVIQLPKLSVGEDTNNSEWITSDYRSFHLTLSGSWQTGGGVKIRYPTVDNAGVSLEEVVEGTWLISTDGNVSLQFDESKLFRKANLVFIKDTNEVPLVNILLSSNDKEYASSGRVVKKDFDAINIGAETFSGIYKWPVFSNKPLEEFWFELETDGTATTYYSNDSNNDGMLSVHEVIVYPGFWKLDEKNKMVIRRYRRSWETSGGEICQPSGYQPQIGEDCFLYNERIWELDSLESGSLQGEAGLYLSQQHKFYNFYIFEPTDYDGVDQIYNLSVTSQTMLKIVKRPVELPE